MHRVQSIRKMTVILKTFMALHARPCLKESIRKIYYILKNSEKSFRAARAALDRALDNLKESREDLKSGKLEKCVDRVNPEKH